MNRCPTHEQLERLLAEKLPDPEGAAALAGAGRTEGVDPLTPDPLSDEERARWRKQALEWLQADLALWGKQLETGKPESGAAVRRTLQHWQADQDLAGARGEAALARLPETERKGWARLWDDVAGLLNKALKLGQP